MKLRQVWGDEVGLGSLGVGELGWSWGWNVRSNGEYSAAFSEYDVCDVDQHVDHLIISGAIYVCFLAVSRQSKGESSEDHGFVYTL